MPELPDLSVIAKNLDKRLAAKKVEKIEFHNKSKLKVSVSQIKKEVEGSKLKKIYREGKEIHFEFNNGNILGLHLMLNGNFNLFEGKNEKKNVIIEFHFDDHSGLALTDYQGVANATLNPVVKDSPDALSDEVNFKFLQEKL